MSTKRDPGAYDCYAKLADDEPYFVLRAKDPAAPALIRLWADLRAAQYGYYEKLGEARQCAADMEKWKLAHPEAKPSVPTAAPTWECGCGAINGVNLDRCGRCTRPRSEGEWCG